MASLDRVHEHQWCFFRLRGALIYPLLCSNIEPTSRRRRLHINRRRSSESNYSLKIIAAVNKLKLSMEKDSMIKLLHVGEASYKSPCALQ